MAEPRKLIRVWGGRVAHIVERRSTDYYGHPCYVTLCDYWADQTGPFAAEEVGGTFTAKELSAFGLPLCKACERKAARADGSDGVKREAAVSMLTRIRRERP